MANPPLPPGWTSAIDPSSGRLYYANAVTGESSWEIPPVLLPPPPSPSCLPPSSRRPPMHQEMQHRFTPQNQPRFQEQQRQQRFVPAQKQTQQPRQTAPIEPAAPAIKALASTGFLVAAARAVVDARKTAPNNLDNQYVELHGLTPGQIADLHSIQQQHTANNKEENATFEPYVPIQPYLLPEMAKSDPMESARLDIRVHSLYEKLKKIQE